MRIYYDLIVWEEIDEYDVDVLKGKFSEFGKRLGGFGILSFSMRSPEARSLTSEQQQAYQQAQQQQQQAYQQAQQQQQQSQQQSQQSQPRQQKQIKNQENEIQEDVLEE